MHFHVMRRTFQMPPLQYTLDAPNALAMSDVQLQSAPYIPELQELASERMMFPKIDQGKRERWFGDHRLPNHVQWTCASSNITAASINTRLRRMVMPEVYIVGVRRA